MARESAIHVEQTGACFVAKCEEYSHFLEAYAQSEMGESCRILETGTLEELCGGRYFSKSLSLACQRAIGRNQVSFILYSTSSNLEI